MVTMKSPCLIVDSSKLIKTLPSSSDQSHTVLNHVALLWYVQTRFYSGSFRWLWPTIFHGGTTLRINSCISEISVYKGGARCHFFVRRSSTWIYCLVMTSIRMFYTRLLCNECNLQGPHTQYTISNPSTRIVISMVLLMPMWTKMANYVLSTHARQSISHWEAYTRLSRQDS